MRAHVLVVQIKRCSIHSLHNAFNDLKERHITVLQGYCCEINIFACGMWVEFWFRSSIKCLLICFSMHVDVTSTSITIIIIMKIVLRFNNLLSHFKRFSNGTPEIFIYLVCFHKSPKQGICEKVTALTENIMLRKSLELNPYIIFFPGHTFSVGNIFSTLDMTVIFSFKLTINLGISIYLP